MLINGYFSTFDVLQMMSQEDVVFVPLFRGDSKKRAYTHSTTLCMEIFSKRRKIFSDNCRGPRDVIEAPSWVALICQHPICRGVSSNRERGEGERNKNGLMQAVGLDVSLVPLDHQREIIGSWYFCPFGRSKIARLSPGWN